MTKQSTAGQKVLLSLLRVLMCCLKGSTGAGISKRLTTLFEIHFRALEIAAWDELFEETNVWLKRKTNPSRAALEK